MQNTRDEVLFDPDRYNKQNYDFRLDKHQLSQEELETYGKMATNIRRRFELDLESIKELKLG